MEYSYKVIEHFMCPRNVGSMPDADAEGTFGDPNCGDYLTVYLKVRDGVISDISYLVFGCGAAVASSSVMSVLAKGKTIADALAISDQDIASELDGLPPIKLHCSVMGAKALENAIKNYREVEKEGRSRYV